MASMGQDELISALNYLGKSTTIPLTGSQNLPTAAAAGAIPAPASPAAAGQASGGGSLGLAGGGLIPQQGPGITAENVLGAGQNIADITKQLFGQQGGGAGSLAGQAAGFVDPASPASVAASAATQANLAAPASLAPDLASGSLDAGLGGLTSGASAGGSLAAGAGPTALETGLELTLPSLSQALGVAAPFIPIIEGFFNQGPLEHGRLDQLFHPPDPLAETKNIRSDFAKAAPGFLGSGATYQAIQNIDPSLPQAQQVQQLQGLLDQATYQLAQGPAVSQFISTKGGAKKGMVSPVDTSGLESVSGPASADAVLSGLMATDRLAKLGAWTPEQDAASPFGNPEGWLGILMAQGGVKGIESGPNSGGVDTSGAGRSSPYGGLLTGDELQSLKAPGSRMDTLRGILSRLNPDFAGSTLGGLMPQAPTAPPVQASSTAQQGVNALGAGAPSPDTLATPGGTSEEEQLKRLLGGL